MSNSDFDKDWRLVRMSRTNTSSALSISRNIPRQALTALWAVLLVAELRFCE